MSESNCTIFHQEAAVFLGISVENCFQQEPCCYSGSKTAKNFPLHFSKVSATQDTHAAVVNMDKVMIKRVSLSKTIFIKQTEGDDTVSIGYLPRGACFQSTGITWLKTIPV